MTALPILSTDGQSYEAALSALDTDSQPSKSSCIQSTDIHACQWHFNNLFLKKFENETKIEAAAVDWSLLKGRLPEGFAIPTGDWTVHDMLVLMRYYYRGRFFIPLDEELGKQFDDSCARLREPPPFNAPFSTEMLEFNTDEEGRKLALEFDSAEDKETRSGSSEDSGRKTDSILIPPPTLALTPAHQLKGIRQLLAKTLLIKYRQHTKSQDTSIQWTLCTVVGLPPSIDLSDVAQIHWVLKNIYRFRFFAPDQYWMMSMFSWDLGKLLHDSSRANQNDLEVEGMLKLLELHYDLIIYKFTPPRLRFIPKKHIFNIRDAMKSDALRKTLIELTIDTFHLRLLKDLSINAPTYKAQSVIIIGVPLSITLPTWKYWTVLQFQTFLSYYHRIQAFSLNQTHLAKDYAERIKALPPPPFVEKFVFTDDGLCIAFDAEGQHLHHQCVSSTTVTGT